MSCSKSKVREAVWRGGIWQANQGPWWAFSRRWAHLVAEVAGRAAVNVIFGVPE